MQALAHPCVQRREALAALGQIEQGGVLRLSARALGVHHHFARDIGGDLGARSSAISASAVVDGATPAEVQISPSRM
ncbi:MAG: hypothetical protein R3C16_07715 [Hyphomonadaceae bacterium]